MSSAPLMNYITAIYFDTLKSGEKFSAVLCLNNITAIGFYLGEQFREELVE